MHRASPTRSRVGSIYHGTRRSLIVCVLLLEPPTYALAQAQSGPVSAITTPVPLETPPANGVTVPDDKPFARLFPNLFDDVRDLASLDSLAVLGVGGALSVAAYPMDRHVTQHASAGGPDQVFAVGSVFGGGYVQAAGAMATYFGGRIANHSPTVRVGADLMRVQVFAGFLTHAAKLAVRRARPGSAPGRMPATYAFPSAHASATFGSATIVWRHFGWKAGIPASLVGAYVGASRLQQNQHFLSDVIFGAALGIAAGRTITVGRGTPEFVIVPSVAARHAAVLLVLERQ